MERILAPTDFSQTSEKAFRYAADLARLFDAEIIILHVFDSRVAENIYHIHQMSAEKAREEMQRSAEESVAKILGTKEAEGLRISTRYAEGIPANVVREEAAEVGADRIVMGTHGQTGITQLLYGSTAEGVVHGAPCPVLTVNP